MHLYAHVLYIQNIECVLVVSSAVWALKESCVCVCVCGGGGCVCVCVMRCVVCVRVKAHSFDAFSFG